MPVKNMDEDELHGFNPQVPTVTGFFGAITFATMILLMQFSESIKFSEFLIPLTALISFFFIVVTIGGAIHASNVEYITKSYRRFIQVCFVIAYYGLIFIIPALVFSFSEIGAYILGGIEIIVVIIFNITSPKIKF